VFLLLCGVCEEFEQSFLDAEMKSIRPLDQKLNIFLQVKCHILIGQKELLQQKQLIIFMSIESRADFVKNNLLFNFVLFIFKNTDYQYVFSLGLHSKY